MAFDIRAGLDPAEAIALSRSTGMTPSETGVRDIIAIAGEGAFGVRDEKGLVGTVSCVVWPREKGALAWIGLMTVAERARRQGIARALLRRSIEHAHARGATTIGLYASDMGRPLYEQEGFVADGAGASAWEKKRDRRAPLPPSGQYAIYPVSPSEIMELLAYDTPRFGANRARWISAMVAREPHRSFVAVHRKTGAFSGHILSMGDRIGPLVADSPDAAAWLLHACESSGTPPKAILLDANPHARAVFEAAGYEHVQGPTPRMMLGGPAPARADACYALGSRALG